MIKLPKMNVLPASLGYLGEVIALDRAGKPQKEEDVPCSWSHPLEYQNHFLADGCNNLVTATFDSLLIRGLNEPDLWAIITEFSYVP